MSLSSSLIQYKELNFLLCPSPTDTTLSAFIKTLKEHDVTTLIRCCEQSYSDEPLKKAGITLLDYDYPDGDVPPERLIESLITLLGQKNVSVNPKEAICIHCKSGLGRGPLLAAIALIERGLSAKETVDMLRGKIRGCINSKQLAYLYSYKARRKRSIQITRLSGYRLFASFPFRNFSSCLP
ncbi:Protein tyrosine phosphatase type IVA 3 isoform X1 [Oopsacas minuta]|uniref:Protein tyrosine phosphatase type IVA 3 n=1 Tax=Oopsacas minuta TaxID=111878 RepID=A0AAV7K9A9_9METZ|nr:Protein tyrosine phosphatase type IVA 3 isoform X1 [Oopsacas minuta]